MPDGRFQIAPEIKRMVRFAPLNLAQDDYPSPANDTHAMDVIFCRNVLMYFTAPQAQKVIENLYRAQAEGGWLLVGPSELPQVSSTPYVAVNFDGAIVYHKDSSKQRRTAKLPWQTKMPPVAPDRPSEEPAAVSALSVTVASREQPLPLAVSHAPDVVETTPDPYAEAMVLYKQGNYAEVVDKLESSPCNELPKPAVFGLLARSLANLGELDHAIDYCDRWIAADKVNLGSHYLRAVILQERGAIDEAVRSFRTALYLDPRFVLAHFALGKIARDRGHLTEARKHLDNALELSAAFRPDDVLPESEGVTAGRFADIIRSLIDAETVR